MQRRVSSSVRHSQADSTKEELLQTRVERLHALCIATQRTESSVFKDMQQDRLCISACHKCRQRRASRMQQRRMPSSVQG
jgi:hypothetical protein